LNGDIFNPDCFGVQGVEQAYYNCINKVKLYGPTKFSDIIYAIDGRSESYDIS